jgi:hypothetical protein
MPLFSRSPKAADESTPLINNMPPSNASDNTPTVYFLERRDSMTAQSAATPMGANLTDAEEIETIPEGSKVEEFQPRPVGAAEGRLAGSGSKTQEKSGGGWFSFFNNVGKKSNAFAGTSAVIDTSAVILSRSAPVKVDPKVSNTKAQ